MSVHRVPSAKTKITNEQNSMRVSDKPRKDIARKVKGEMRQSSPKRLLTLEGSEGKGLTERGGFVRSDRVSVRLRLSVEGRPHLRSPRRSTDLMFQPGNQFRKEVTESNDLSENSLSSPLSGVPCLWAGWCRTRKGKERLQKRGRDLRTS